MIRFCEIILPNFSRIDSYLQVSKTKQISNFGPLYWLFKERLEQYLGLSSKTITITSSGHTALMAAVSILGSKKVIVPSYTFASTYQAVALQGVEVQVIDVDINTGLPKLDILERLDFDTLVLVCPLSIVSPELQTYDKWCKLHSKKLIIDGAATFGTQGSHFELGDIYCLSFHATKNLPVGECGCLIHSKSLEVIAKQYISFGLDNHKKIVGPGINGKVSDYTCAIGLVLLEDIQPHLQKRIENTNLYKKLLNNYKFLSSVNNTVYSSFPIYSKDKEYALSKIDTLRKHDCEAIQYYYPLDQSENANQLFNTSICLPCHSSITEEQIRFIAEVLNG